MAPKIPRKISVEEYKFRKQAQKKRSTNVGKKPVPKIPRRKTAAPRKKAEKLHASGVTQAAWDAKHAPKRMVSTPGVVGQKYKTGKSGAILDERGRRVSKVERERLGRSLGKKAVVDPLTGRTNMAPDVAGAQLRQAPDQSIKGSRRMLPTDTAPGEPLRQAEDLRPGETGEDITRRAPTVATADQAVITRGEQPPIPQDMEKMLEDIAVKKATGQTLTEEELRTEFQAARQQPMAGPEMPQISPDPHMPAEYAGLSAEQISMLPPAEQARYNQYAEQAGLKRQREFMGEMEGQIDDIYGERIGAAEAAEAAAREKGMAEIDPVLQEFKDLRETMDADDIKAIKEAGAEGMTQIQNMMARRGFGRSSATAEQLQKASANTQGRIAEIEAATGMAVSEYQVQLMDKLDNKMAKYEARVDKYKDAKDVAKLQQAQNDINLAQQIFEADPKSPAKVMELANTLTQQRIADKEALQASAVSKFEKALELGYIPTGMTAEEGSVLADNLGIAQEDLPQAMYDMLGRAQRKSQMGEVHYEQDPWGNTTAIMPNFDTGQFDTVVVAQGPYGARPSGGLAGSSSYGPGTYQSYGSVSDEGLSEVFPIGEEVGWCGVYASTLSTAPAVGNYWSEKKKKITHNDNPTPGNKVVIPMGVHTDAGNGAGEYGHVATVIDFDPATGNFKVVESNADGRQNRGEGPGKVSLGTYNVNELNQMYPGWGFVEGEFKQGIKDKLGQHATPPSTVAEAYPQYGAQKGYNEFLNEAFGQGMLPDAAQDYAMKQLEWQKEEPQKLIDNSQKLAGRYKPLQDEVRTLEQGFAITQGFDVNTTNPYDDQALIFSFMKVMDPGSVVREGEFNTAMRNASMLESFGAEVNKAITGEGMLLPDQRQKMLSTMQNLYKTKRGTYDAEIDNAKRTGMDLGINPDLYLTIPEAGGGQAAAAPTEPPQAPADVSGSITSARESGYSDDDIVGYLQGDPQYSTQIQQAVDAGYSPEDIINYLMQS